MTESKRKYVFGPVPSRRLGRSLGVDLLPHKVCSLDCVYCQLAHTTVKTTRRGAYVPAAEVLAELRSALAGGVSCDYITLSGSGEPTLHSDLGVVVSAITAMTDIPLAVITNGTTLSDPEVRAALAPADLVIPSLDAGDAETFAAINRPCEEIDFDVYVEGLKAFVREFPGRVHLEVFLAAGINDSDQQVRKIRTIADEIAPDRIDVNTVTRPPADSAVRAVEPDRLRHLCELLGPSAHIIAAGHDHSELSVAASRDDVLGMLRRRPCTLDDLAVGLGCPRDALIGLLEGLAEESLITTTDQDGLSYYQTADPQGR